ncbi:neurexin-3 isoform X2 [Octopus sinensis]|uniref:Neurexin-3 isoform X2 n=1 Tax=Octopus sinensis TaxID=2607531 RepID=A0A6P7S955_9MOLL|nr:neurexin-3 isoform X2 [Octopus sinensis]
MGPHPIWMLLSLSAITLCVAFDLQGSKPSYAKFTKWEPCDNGTLTFQFKTDRGDALLMYTDGGEDYDFMELKLVDGTLKLRFDLGGGAMIMSVGQRLNNMQWHTVEIQRAKAQTNLVVNNIAETMETKPYDIVREEENKESFVFIGGMPMEYGAKLDRLALPSVIFEPQFRGSIQKVLYSNCGGPMEAPLRLEESGIRGTEKDLCLENDPCLNGGTCLTTDKRVVCECTGTSYIGDFCQIEKPIVEATFTGVEYLTYDLSGRGDSFVSSKDKLTMYFKTRHADGLLFYTGDLGEYFNVALIGGGVDLSVNLGSGKYDANINPPNQRFDDNKWHLVEVTRESRELAKDRGLFVITFQVDTIKKIGTTIGTFTLLSSKVLFLGGSLNTLNLPGSKLKQNFKGCMRKVFYKADGIELNLIELGRDKHDLIDVVGDVQFGKCHIHIDPEPITFTSPDSFITLPKWDVSKGGNLSLKFVTNEPNSVLLYNSRSENHDDFLAVEMLDGFLFFVFSIGLNSQRLRVTEQKINDASVHEIYINMTKEAGYIDVDGHRTDYAIPGKSVLSPHGKLYLGGIGDREDRFLLPKEIWAGVLGYGFVGCLTNFFMNGESFELPALSVEQMVPGVKNECQNMKSQCLKRPCLHQGNCAKGWNRFICDCRQTGYYGTLCEHVASTLHFEGTQFMKITLEGESKSEVEDISLRFNTVRPHGLLFLAASGKSKDIMELLLESGTIKFTIKLGSGTRTLITGQSLNDGQWHTVFVKRRARTVELAVDYNLPVTDKLPELRKTLKYEYIYIGSIGPVPSEELPATSSVSEFHGEASKLTDDNTIHGYASFIGLMQQLVFNKKHYFEMAKSGKAKNIEVTAQFDGGSNIARDPITFKQTSAFAELSTLNIHLLFVISFKFKTTEPDGLLLYSGGKEKDFLALELVDGYIYYAYNLGNGPQVIKGNTPGPLNDNQWHLVSLSRLEKNSQLFRVDINPTERIRVLDGKAIHFDLEGPLYLGGVKKTVFADLPKSIRSKHGFQGCMASIDLNDIYPKVLTNATHLHGPVIAGCKGPNRECHPEACLNQGECMQQWNSYICNCDLTSYSGHSCSEESTTYHFGPNPGLLQYTYPAKKRKDRTEDLLAFGLKTKQKDAVLVRVQSKDSDDYLEAELVDGNIFVVYNMGTADHPVGEVYHKVNDGEYHVVRFTRNGANSTIQVDNYKPQPKHPDEEFGPMHVFPSEQMSIFNNQAYIYIGGKKDSWDSQIQKAYRGEISGLVFNGLKVLDMAAANNSRISIEGNVKLVKQFVPKKKESTEVQEMQSTMGVRVTPHQSATDDIIYSGNDAGCNSDDEDECSSVGSGMVDEIITPTVIVITTPRPIDSSPRSISTPPEPSQPGRNNHQNSIGNGASSVKTRPSITPDNPTNTLETETNQFPGKTFENSDDLNIGLIVGIAAGVLVALIVLIIALYKFRSRDEGSYKIDETQNFAYLDSKQQQSNGALLPHNTTPGGGLGGGIGGMGGMGGGMGGSIVSGGGGGGKSGKKKDVKEWYV